jgi:hypothetical protein
MRQSMYSLMLFGLFRFRIDMEQWPLTHDSDSVCEHQFIATLLLSEHRKTWTRVHVRRRCDPTERVFFTIYVKRQGDEERLHSVFCIKLYHYVLAT